MMQFALFKTRSIVFQPPYRHIPGPPRADRDDDEGKRGPGVIQVELGRPGRLVGTRELVIPDTPYVIPYRVRRDRLELIAVFHSRQKWPMKL